MSSFQEWAAISFLCFFYSPGPLVVVIFSPEFIVVFEMFGPIKAILPLPETSIPLYNS